MESHKQSTIVYALGFIEDYIESGIVPIEVAAEDQNDESYIVHVRNENEHRAQVEAMWRVLDEGVKQLLAENGRLLSKIAMAEMALKG